MERPSIVPGRRLEVACRVLGVDAALDRRARAVGDVSLIAQRLAGGDADLLLHEVDAGHHLGHRVLDLDAGVHLHEVERPVLVEQELDRAGADVVDRLGAGARRPRPCARADAGVMRGRRRLPRSASGGAAGPSSRARRGGSRCRACRRGSGTRCAAAARCTSRGRLAVAERRLRLGARQLERAARTRSSSSRDAHALAAAARRRLDDDRKADLLGELERLVRRPRRARRCRGRSGRRSRHRACAPRLVAHHADLLAAWAR